MENGREKRDLGKWEDKRPTETWEEWEKRVKAMEELKEELKEENKYINLWEKIDGTPFCTIQSEQDGEYRIALGRYVIDENTYQTREEAINETKQITWERILNVITAVVDYREKENEKRLKSQE